MSKKQSKPTDPREAALQTAFNACRHGEAESIFAGWVKAGKVVQDGETGGMKIYLCKGVAYM